MFCQMHTHMRCDQTEWVGSRQRHVTGFRSFISCKYNVNANVKPCICCKYIIDVTRSYKLTCYVNPNTVGVHKCLVSNSIDLSLKYKCNLKPVTCCYQSCDSVWLIISYILVFWIYISAKLVFAHLLHFCISSCNLILFI